MVSAGTKRKNRGGSPEETIFDIEHEVSCFSGPNVTVAVPHGQPLAAQLLMKGKRGT
jgi:hypothetical protein